LRKRNCGGTLGNVASDGWCSPFFIAPNGASPNGYELDIGDASPRVATATGIWKAALSPARM
jgi:hypothetical protein